MNALKILMSAVLILCLGIVLGLYLPFFQQKNTAPPDLNLPLTVIYTHKAEGEKKQYLDFIDDPLYQSAEGNDATLFQLKDYCKINVSINGESFYAYKTVYFHQQKIIHMMQTIYRESAMGRITDFTDSPRLIYSQEIFNPNSALVQQEFTNLIGYFDPSFIEKC